MRVLLLAMLAGCTLGNARPAAVTARPPHDPDRMPSAVLDNQDPGADTSKNPVLTRSSAHYVDPSDTHRWPGCLSLLSCNSGTHGDASGLLVVLAVLVATKRRRNTS